VNTIAKRSIGRVCLGVPLLYGVVPAVIGVVILREWEAFSVAVIVFAVLFFLGGMVMLSSLLWLSGTVGRSRRPLWAGGIASIFNAIIFASVTVTDILPCSGPD
jgi:hypothetical protein